MAWVVASNPPGCRGSGHSGARSDRPSCGAPAAPADLIWAQGMENLFHEVLHQSREPESEQISPWERSLEQLCPVPAPHINHQPTVPMAPPTYFTTTGPRGTTL